MSNGRPTFLFDSDCGICNRLMRMASFLDASHTVDFVPIADAGRLGYLDSVPVGEWYSCSRMLLPEGRITSGGDAMVDLLRYLPGGRLPSLALSKIPYGLASARWTYGVVSRLHGGACSAAHYSTVSPKISSSWSSL